MSDSYGRTPEGLFKGILDDIAALKGRRSFRPYSYTPTGTADPYGNVGDEAYDDDYKYLKTDAGWKRAGYSTF